jgi:hypothetical protein
MDYLRCLLLCLLATAAWSMPTRGHYPFAIALCNYPGITEPDIDINDVEKFFTSAGASKPGLYRYIQEQSYGIVDFEGTIVKGWFTTDPSYITMLKYTRQQRLNACRRAAEKAGFIVPPV